MFDRTSPQEKASHDTGQPGRALASPAAFAVALLVALCGIVYAPGSTGRVAHAQEMPPPNPAVEGAVRGALEANAGPVEDPNDPFAVPVTAERNEAVKAAAMGVGVPENVAVVMAGAATGEFEGCQQVGRPVEECIQAGVDAAMRAFAEAGSPIVPPPGEEPTPPADPPPPSAPPPPADPPPPVEQPTAENNYARVKNSGGYIAQTCAEWNSAAPVVCSGYKSNPMEWFIDFPADATYVKIRFLKPTGEVEAVEIFDTSRNYCYEFSGIATTAYVEEVDC